MPCLIMLVGIHNLLVHAAQLQNILLVQRRGILSANVWVHGSGRFFVGLAKVISATIRTEVIAVTEPTVAMVAVPLHQHEFFFWFHCVPSVDVLAEHQGRFSLVLYTSSTCCAEQQRTAGQRWAGFVLTT